MVFKVLGCLLIGFGLVDWIGSYADLDVWMDWFGVQLPELLWSLSPYIEITLGYFLINTGNRLQTEATESTPAA